MYLRSGTTRIVWPYLAKLGPRVDPLLYLRVEYASDLFASDLKYDPGRRQRQ